MAWPCSSTTQTYEMTSSYGAVSRVATAVMRLERNQPRYCSAPSSYALAGNFIPRSTSTARQVTPDSNQMSTMLNSLANAVPPQLGQAIPTGAKVSHGSVHHRSDALPASNGRARIAVAKARASRGSSSDSLHTLQTTEGIGVPQTRWRETHHSGWLPTICDMRVSPHGGTHFTSCTARSARARSALRSIPINHCAVARKTTGFLQRQQCG